MDIAIRVHIAEPRTNRLIDEQQVGELVPRALIVFQCMIILQPIGSHLHQRAIHRATTRTAVQPNNGPLSIRDMTVLIMPKEQITIVLGVHLDVSNQKPSISECSCLMSPRMIPSIA